MPIRCPYGVTGDRLWVRETWQCVEHIGGNVSESVVYRADEGTEWLRDDIGWKPSIFMPRWACRILLEITAVRLERLQDIDELDALAEGVEGKTVHGTIREAGKPPRTGEFIDGSAHDAFRDLWESINGNRGFGWDINPWVWAIDFRVLNTEN